MYDKENLLQNIFFKVIFPPNGRKWVGFLWCYFSKQISDGAIIDD